MDNKNINPGTKSTLTILIAILIVCILVFTFVFFDFYRKTEKKQSDLEKEIETLSNEIIQLKQLVSSLSTRLTPEEAEKEISQRASEVILVLKEFDMLKLSSYVHPEIGLRFSPYSYVSIKDDLVFKASEIPGLKNSKAIFNWGTYDGSGLPIKLTFDEYYKKFVYDKDFANARIIAYNAIIGRGNMKNNNFEVYPRSIIVEYHFPGFDPQYEGMDWESLRLVFSKLESTWYLVGIIHDQWTI